MSLGDDALWIPAETLRRELVPEDGPSEAELTRKREEIARHARDIDRRWESFVLAVARNPNPAPEPKLPPPDEDHAFTHAVLAVLRLSHQQDQQLMEWFRTVATGGPLDPQGFGAFQGRHLELGTVRGGDISDINAMIAMQLVWQSALRQYDARTGLEFDWSGKPHEMVLAAALGQYASTRLGSMELLEECSVLLWYSLNALDELSGGRLAPDLRQRIGRHREALEARFGDSAGRARIDSAIESLRAKKRQRD